MREITITIPEQAKKILDTLHAAGFEAYVVGGCVRDSILGRKPGDWDITTSALPEQVKALFHRTIDTGIQHGTVTVMEGHGEDREGYEVTTYRVDGEYKDGRHPESVTFTRSLLEDLKRRDFTINAMAYSEETGIVDEFDGLGDMERRLIRAVGVPRERFEEDALRIMRAIRFAAQLDYDIDPETQKAAKILAGNLQKVSAERIRVELEKLLVSDHPDKLRGAIDLGITREVLPELDACMEVEQHNPHHAYTVGEHILRAVSAVRADKVLRLTMLLHDIGKPLCKTTDADGVDHFYGHVTKGAEMADAILRRLKYDNDTRKKVVQLVRCHDLRPKNTPTEIRKAVVAIGEDLFPLWLEVKLSDGAAQSDYRLEEKQALVDSWRKTYEEILSSHDCLSLRDLAVNGKDLTALGMKGTAVGEVLKIMLSDVLETPSHNRKEYLLDFYEKNGIIKPENAVN